MGLRSGCSSGINCDLKHIVITTTPMESVHWELQLFKKHSFLDMVTRRERTNADWRRRGYKAYAMHSPTMCPSSMAKSNSIWQSGGLWKKSSKKIFYETFNSFSNSAFKEKTFIKTPFLLKLL